MASDIVLVPGMCSLGDVVFKQLVKRIKTTMPEVTTHVVNLPSVDAINTKVDLTPNGLVADINAIKALIKSLVNEGKSVVIVAHSYGGTPALYATEGLWVKQAASGGVKKVGLISSSLTLPGGTIAGDRQVWKEENGEIQDPTPEMEQHGKEMFVLPTGFEHAWMNDLPDHEELRSSLRPSPLSTAISPTPEADIKQWDIAYLITTDLDLAMPKLFQKYLAERARENGASVKCDTIKSGHFVQVSHDTEVAEWIKKIA